MKAKDILIYWMLDSHRSVLYHQKLIDKWDDPKDSLQRAAVVIRTVHELYGKLLYDIYEELNYAKN